MLRILLVEDHALLRESLAQLLLTMREQVEIEQAGDAAVALEKLQAGHVFDLVLLDLALPGMDGLTCLDRIKALAPDLPVAVLSGYDDVQTVQRVLACGAAGFIPKRYSGDALISALSKILNGKRFRPSARTGEVPIVANTVSVPKRDVAVAIDAKNFGLTDRQGSVLELLVAGLSNREIAENLGLREGTIKIHLNTIFKILGVNSRAQAIVAITRQGI